MCDLKTSRSASIPASPQVLKDVNLEIPAGTFVGIVGQSGSGKSTLMKLLPRLYDPRPRPDPDR